MARRLSGLIATILVAGMMAAASLQPASAQQTCTSYFSGGEPGLGCGGVAAQEAVNQTAQGVVLNIRQSVMQSLQRPAVALDNVNPMETTGFALPWESASPLDPDIASSFNAMPPSGSSNGAIMRKAIAPDWLYGVNLIGSGDKGIAINTDVTVASVVGAVDVTKIGIFSSTDALTFIGTGIHSWASIDNAKSATIPSTSATLVYMNGGFSTDLSALASWTSTHMWLGNTRVMGYTANFQYRYDAPHSVWFEPTMGVGYSELFTHDWAGTNGNSTEVHGGLRFGAETKWMGYTVQPTLSGIAFKVVSQNGAEPVWNDILTAMVKPAGAVGFRGSAKLTVLWQKDFSSYIDLHATTMSSPDMPNIQILGVQGGVRYTF